MSRRSRRYSRVPTSTGGVHASSVRRRAFAAILNSLVDGYAIIVKAIGMKGGDPEMEMAAALAKWDRNGSHLAHLQRSIAGAPEGSLLAKNLVSHFNNMGKTIAELRANVATAKN